MFSMSILPKEEADGDPVGEAQEEPNQNPWLKKPTAGRGFGGVSLGGGFDFEFSWNPFGKYLPFILALILLIGILALVMYLKIMQIL